MLMVFIVGLVNKHHSIFQIFSQTISLTRLDISYRGGDWKTGGTCHLETLPDVTPIKSLEQWADLLEHINHVLWNRITNKLVGMDILNVTQMTALRKDGHLSVYLSPSGPASHHRQDCSHWCLPGVPDAWNELLYALFLRRKMVMPHNVSSVGAKRLNTGW